MKKLLLVALVVSFGLVVPVAAQMGCVNFDLFCDALELEMDGVNIVGTWVSWDCAGSSVPLDGFIDDGDATVFCLESNDCPNGNSYVFTIGRSTFDLLERVGEGNYDLLQDNTPWTFSDGACPTEPVDGLVSTVQ